MAIPTMAIPTRCTRPARSPLLTLVHDSCAEPLAHGSLFTRLYHQAPAADGRLARVRGRLGEGLGLALHEPLPPRGPGC
eukprot:scaffold73819_cov47-Phaeocystis_antarctica.AAC.2